MTLIGTASALWLGNTTQVKNNGTDPSLVGWWKLDGNAKDSSGNNNNGTILGSVVPATDHQKITNGAMSFPGINQNCIQIPNSAKLQNVPNNQWTMSAWIHPNSTSDYTIFRKGDGGGGYYVEIVGGKLHSLFSTNGNDSSSTYVTLTGGSIVANKWQLVTVEYDGSQIKNYINGTLVASASAPGQTLVFDSQYMAIGSYTWQNCGGNSFNGSIDDIRIYSRDLSAVEIARLYSPPAATLDSSQQGLVGWWKLNGNTKDSTPYANNGAWIGSPAYTTDREGVANRVANFNGSSYVKLANTSTLNTLARPNMTISAWVYPTNTSNYHQVFGDNGPWILYVYNGTVTVGLQYAATDWQWLSSPTGSVVSGKWQLLTATFSGTNLTIYINGTQLTTATLNTSSGLSTYANNIAIGGDPSSGRNFNGSISDVRLYNHALSASEIKAQYQSYNSQIALQSPTSTSSVNLNAGLVGWWPFNGNAKDATVYQNNGVITGGVTPTTDRNGRANSAYAFDGTTGYIKIPNGNGELLKAHDSGEVTYSMWAKGNSGGLFYRGSNDGNGTVASCQYEPNISGGSASLSGCGGTGNFASFGVSPSNWRMVTVVFDNANNSAKVYTNNSLVASTTITTIKSASDHSGLILNAQSTIPFSLIGAEYGVVGGTFGFFNGSIDDVRIYNRALSAAEVQALYNTYN